MRSSNVQGFASKVITLYEEEEEEEELHCATVNCSEKTSLRAGGT